MLFKGFVVIGMFLLFSKMVDHSDTLQSRIILLGQDAVAVVANHIGPVWILLLFLSSLLWIMFDR